MCENYMNGEKGSKVNILVERVDKQRWRSSCCRAASYVSENPEAKALRFLEAEHGLEPVLEGKVQSLCREVADNIRPIASPDCVSYMDQNVLRVCGSDRGWLTADHAFIFVRPCEAINDAFIRFIKPSGFNHRSLVLDQKLDTLDGCSGRFANWCSNTYKILSIFLLWCPRRKKCNLPPIMKSTTCKYIKIEYI